MMKILTKGAEVSWRGYSRYIVGEVQGHTRKWGRDWVIVQWLTSGIPYDENPEHVILLLEFPRTQRS